MDPRYQRSENEHILYDAALLEDAPPALFDPAAWQGRGAATVEARGRGRVCFVRDGGRTYVLRHYRRGGLLAPLLGDYYLWTGLARTRAWREWRLLAEMHQQGLPVPRPVAARVVRSGARYRADLLTEALPDVRPLSELWLQGPLPTEVWQRVGACLRRFHAAGYFHADLNAHNIVLDEAYGVFVLDFDRGRRRRPGAWQEANLQRLARSLRKLSPGANTAFSASWAALLAGYRGSTS